MARRNATLAIAGEISVRPAVLLQVMPEVGPAAASP
jgi:hypothetical protein